MNSDAAIVVAIFAAVFLPMFLTMSGWKEEQERARQRRMAEHRKSARLLRLDI